MDNRRNYFFGDWAGLCHLPLYGPGLGTSGQVASKGSQATNSNINYYPDDNGNSHSGKYSTGDSDTSAANPSGSFGRYRSVYY